MAETRRKFTPELKREAVALLAPVADRAGGKGSPPQQPAGLPGSAPASPVASPSDRAAEIARLRRDPDRTRMERDVLKKPIGIFAAMPK